VYNGALPGGRMIVFVRQDGTVAAHPSRNVQILLGALAEEQDAKRHAEGFGKTGAGRNHY
jgi:hypothetical protein